MWSNELALDLDFFLSGKMLADIKDSHGLRRKLTSSYIQYTQVLASPYLILHYTRTEWIDRRQKTTICDAIIEGIRRGALKLRTRVPDASSASARARILIH
jgi:hypothetical protein